MKAWQWIPLVIFILGGDRVAASDPLDAEGRAQRDLQNGLERLVPEGQYIVQVTAKVEMRQERKLMEGEQIMQQNFAPPVSTPPPLPGFVVNPPPERKEANPSQMRQVYTTVEKPELKSIGVLLSLDKSISNEIAKQAESFVQNYLQVQFPGVSQFRVQRLSMLAPVKNSSIGSDGGAWVKWIPWLLGGLLLLALFWIWKSKRKAEVTSYPRALDPEPIEDVEVEKASKPMELSHQSMPPLPRLPHFQNSSRPQLDFGGKTPGKEFPPLPVSENFIDRRALLLDLFFKNSDVFKSYFYRLPQGAQSELYAALRGPAFDSLLEAVGIEIPKGGAEAAPPSEEEMTFYTKNFDEFLRASDWQKEQFFGFMANLSGDQIGTLVKSHNGLVSALILKFSKPALTAKILAEMRPEKRQEILGQAQRLAELNSEELRAIESTVRSQITDLPKYVSRSIEDEIQYWAKVLGQAKDQEGILMDLQSTRPDLYQALAKYRFKLEDLAALPSPLIQKVLQGSDNEELALALQTCGPDVSGYVINLLHPDRAQIISDQLAMYSGLPREKLETARQNLTVRFREVLT